MIPDEQYRALDTISVSVSFAVPYGLFLTIPLVAELILQRGLVWALWTMVRLAYTQGVFFFIFHIRTKAYYYERTLRKLLLLKSAANCCYCSIFSTSFHLIRSEWCCTNVHLLLLLAVIGGAGYKPTGRSFVLSHTRFLSLFQQFHYSHLSYGMMLVLNLLVYRCFVVETDDYMSVMAWTWVFAATLLWTPFFFNCNALDRAEVLKDWQEWENFLWREDVAGDRELKEAAKDSWRAYFEFENEVFLNVSMYTRATFIARESVYAILALCI
eukprot:COSAG01_NODE_22645_length_847_cov_1.189840_1_plen_269_part_10